jgi:phenylalanyl-tRNA synthetase beta chain
VADGETATVEVPSWRPDVEGKADLVEEVVRIAGLDRVPSTPMTRIEASVAKPVLTLMQKRTRSRSASSRRAGSSRR